LELDPVQAEFGVLVGAASDDTDVSEAVGVLECRRDGRKLA
jgi:hypothetical protein